MVDYPPKLAQVTETAFGSLLTLSDGSAVPINISPARLRQAIQEQRPPELAGYFTPEPLGVYRDEWLLTPEEWDQIRAIVLASRVVANALREASATWNLFFQPASAVRDLPRRVYGGLSKAIYTSHPFQFRIGFSRPVPWLYSQLNASGGRLFRLHVHLERGEVEVERHVKMGHYVE